MQSKFWVLFIALSLGSVLLFGQTARSQDIIIPDQPICIYWKVDSQGAIKAGGAPRFWTGNPPPTNDRCKFVLTYKCLTQSGLKTFKADIDHYTGFILDGVPYTIEFDVLNENGAKAKDVFGNPIKGMALATSGEQIVDIMVAEHTMVAGFHYDNIFSEVYDDLPPEDGLNNWWHIWTFTLPSDFVWTSPGFEEYLE